MPTKVYKRRKPRVRSKKAWKLAKSAARSVLRKASELKRVIAYSLDSNCGDPSVPYTSSLVTIPQGDGINQRVGNQLRLKSVFCRLFLQIPNNNTNSSINNNCNAVFRVCLYTPKSSNLAQNYPNLTDKTKRFPTINGDFDLIKEKWVVINPTASYNAVSMGMVSSNTYQQRMITISKKFPYLGRKLDYKTGSTEPNEGQVMLAVYGYGGQSVLSTSLKVSLQKSTFYYDD